MEQLTTVLRWITAGESHGPALVALVEGMVAGVEVTSSEIAEQLARRRLGYGRGARMKFEADKVTLIGGLRHGRTMGGPVAIEIGNTEWPKWETVMSPDPVDPGELEGSARNAPLTRPRPGHADYSGMLKYGFDDARPVLERASARETAARVAAGTVARNFLRQVLGIEVLSHVISIGDSAPYVGPPPRYADLTAIDASPVRAFDADAEKACRDICAAAARLDIPLEYNMAGLTLQDRPDGSLGYTRDEFWRIAAEYPVKAIMGCDAHAPSELDVVPAIEEKKAFLHSLGIPVLDTLPGLE